jgi:hypothetical protein
MSTRKSILLASALYLSSIECMYGKVQNSSKQVNINRTPKDVVPKNMKYFSFREDGSFSVYGQDYPVKKDECVFSCYALNYKNAIKKFNKEYKNK